MSRGVLIIVSSPSGAGKTTLARRLLAEFADIQFSVSYTTRPIRPGERDGIDYHFVDAEAFEHMVERSQFAEHAWVHGNRYGTARAPVDAALAAGQDVIFDVDWQGGAALSATWPDESLKIFILPPDLQTLADRLRRRATDSAAVIEARLMKAIEELQHFPEYHHLIVNDEMERAYTVLRAIYLTRKYGSSARADIEYPLGDLAAHVERNRASGNEDHARRLASSAS